MKIAIMTSSYHGFFPRFYEYLSHVIQENGHCPVLLLPTNSTNKKIEKEEKILWGSRLNWFIHYHLYKYTGIQDIFSFFETLILLWKLKEIKPTIIHMHMVNAWFLNFPLFIHYVNSHNIPIVWTMHDCRAFTGRCAYFDEIGCKKWKNGCKNCQQEKLYSPALLHNEGLQWKIRNYYFNKFSDLYIVTPSKWLAGLIRQSFLRKYPLMTINNGIDLSLFAKQTKTGLKEEIGIKEKKLILGIAANWEYRKGLDYFVFLSQNLASDKYAVVLVGNIPDGNIPKYEKILQLPRTKSSEELVRLYQSADVFVNPTLADNFPTTNIEALASGTPVVTFNTGGSGESIDSSCGAIVETGNYCALLNAVVMVCNNHSINSETCRKRASLYSLSQYEQYVHLYNRLNRCNI